MSQEAKDTSIMHGKTSIFPNDFSITDIENIEAPQQSSTPSKINKNVSKSILKCCNSLNINVIKKPNQYKPKLPVAEIFYSGSENESTRTEISGTNNSDDKLITVCDVLKDDCTNVSDVFTEFEVRFDKPPKRMYPGRKRNNQTILGENEKNDEEIEVKVTKKNKKHKQIKKIDLQEEAFIQSISDHFNDIETSSILVE